MMSMVKNQHLLIAIAVLGLGSALACVMLIVSERANATELAHLRGENENAHKQIQDRADRQIAETNKQLAELGQQHASLKAKYTQMQAALTRLEKDLAGANAELRTHTQLLNTLKQKPWLLSGETPWDIKLHAYQERLKKVEEQLNKIIGKKDAGNK